MVSNDPDRPSCRKYGHVLALLENFEFEEKIGKSLVLKESDGVFNMVMGASVVVGGLGKPAVFADVTNDSDYGLAGGVWSGSDQRAMAVARRMRTGAVEVRGSGFNIAAPFGGYKQSGYSRENGPFGIEEFLQTKSLQH